MPPLPPPAPPRCSAPPGSMHTNASRAVTEGGATWTSDLHADERQLDAWDSQCRAGTSSRCYGL
eukprot:6403883-Pyramimonas_sp.AAC.1